MSENVKPSPTGAAGQAQAQTLSTQGAGSTPLSDFSQQPKTLPQGKPAKRTEPEKLQAVSALLGAGLDAPGDPGPGAAPEGLPSGSLESDPAPAPEAKPKAFLELAEKLGISPEELYGLEISTGDGETLTIGALKDAYGARQAAGLETTRRAVELDERESALINRQLLWDQLGGELSKALTPDMRQAMERNQVDRENRERDLFLKALPEMRDKAVWDRFREDVVQTLSAEGWTIPEMNIQDSRQLKFIRKFQNMERRLKEYESYTPKAEPPKAQVPQGRGNGARPATGRAANPGEALSRVAALLNKR